jgi:hypothetical protein
LKYMIVMMYIVYTPTRIQVKCVLPVCRPKVECLIWSTQLRTPKTSDQITLLLISKVKTSVI